MTHTIESLCSLLNAEGVPINAEAEQQLCIWTAEADGWKNSPRQLVLSGIIIKDEFPWEREDGRRQRTSGLPDYPTSLDAIYAAEKRAGLHEQASFEDAKRSYEWHYTLMQVFRVLSGDHTLTPDHRYAFATPAQRCIAFILTMQEKNNS